MLSSSEAKAYYDKFGKKQDSQAFYEDAATSLLVAHGDFQGAKAVFEFGVGTGRFAERLLSDVLSSDCRYSGVDISSTMITLAEERLRKFGSRAAVRLSSGSSELKEQNNSYDRFVSNYVLDLLSDEEAASVIDEAYRILRRDGLLCMVSLSFGHTLPTRVISSAWKAIYNINAKFVGGCRPIELKTHVPESKWGIQLCTTISAYGITSEVLVARKH